ncbi:MAG TPA: MFS transporter [Actinomycetaceae bacterium]|nr:MFS transporter [Actinomycetaceae bacterium]
MTASGAASQGDHASPREASPAGHEPSTRAWIVVFFCGVVAAMHVWKFPGAMQFIRADLGMTLVEAGTLLGIVQVASMVLGLAVSIYSVRTGLRNTLTTGLALLMVGSILGALATQTWHLMASRALEGIGFLFVTVVGPPLIRHWAPPHRTNTAMGWWSAFQGAAVFLAMIVSTLLLQYTGVITWHGWWLVMAAASLVVAVLALLYVPQDHTEPVNLAAATRRITATISRLMPWIMAVLFALYTLQWGAIIGFLPDIAAASGLGAIAAGLATAIVGGLNGVGNIVAVAILQRGVSPRGMVMFGMASMIVTTTLIFAPNWSAVPGGHWYQLAIAGIFSGAAAVIPSVINRIAVDVAPPEGAPSAVIGLMSQVYNGGNFIGPIVLTALATAAGGWHMSWLVTGSAALIGLVLAAIFLTPHRLAVSSRPGPAAKPA